ncbi:MULTISPECIES: DUF3105 domain-containing protein [unclassified Nocardioides]|uniref:DUF3105 domain-containing protein n=1 Tax=unclassified Nocardioides TaxID=2615069 RepID=UPI0007028233|nr:MULTISPECIES: DUF3105 domain-containing protein [unclassified Nocardioides]KRC46276.1 hypothetical protein ASE19_20765 [Nocardioides sp. Root79]KRC69623.1 hypothetical protein ASE20_13625 [Nocardioides sp. Root240]
MAKSSKSEKSDRRQVIEEIRRKQKSADKRQGRAIIGVCVLVALLIVGAAAWSPVKTAIEKARYSGKDLADIGAPASTCGKVTEEEATGSGDHVDKSEQVKYDHAPPAYGKHWNEAGLAPAPITDRYYTEGTRPELESLVHNLEHGYTILWYDDTAADDSGEIAAIKAMAATLDANDTNQRLKFKAAPWTKADSKETGKGFPKGMHVAFTHWRNDAAANKSYGVWQYCSEASGAALKQFMTDYPFTDAPEPFVY